MYSFTDQFMADEKNRRFAQDNMMGPNAMRVSEEMASFLDITKDMRILDLGCGCGLSTLLLAKKYGATVFAADLWISPTDNYHRFEQMGVSGKAIPVSADATQGLPFAHGYFDVLFSVGAYQYFGATTQMLPALIPYVKKGGYIAIALNGIQYEFGEDVPDEMKPFWTDEVASTIHCLDWWKNIWEQEKGIEIIDLREMACCKQGWEEWVSGYHPNLQFAEIVEQSIREVEADDGKYYNLIQLIAKVI